MQLYINSLLCLLQLMMIYLTIQRILDLEYILIKILPGNQQKLMSLIYHIINLLKIRDKALICYGIKLRLTPYFNQNVLENNLFFGYNKNANQMIKIV